MPALSPSTAPFFIGRTVRNRKTWNPAKLVGTMNGGTQIKVIPQKHGGVTETCDTSDYDAFVSRNPDLRYLFSNDLLEDDEPEPDTNANDTQTPIETFTMQDPDSLIPNPQPEAAAEDDLLSSLMRMKTVRAEIADLESALTLKRLELTSLQKDARALRTMLDEVIGDDAPRTPPKALVLPGTSPLITSRTRLIVDWARSINGPFTREEAVTALGSHELFSTLPVETRAHAFSFVLEKQPAFRKVGRGTYRLA